MRAPPVGPQADAPEALADAVLTDLLTPGGATGDTALAIVRP
ncbi:hypothetical protein [Streptomyces sp. NPDC002676]